MNVLTYSLTPVFFFFFTKSKKSFTHFFFSRKECCYNIVQEVFGNSSRDVQISVTNESEQKH